MQQPAASWSGAKWDPMAAIEHLCAADPFLGRQIDRVGACTLKPYRGSIFDGLLKSIVYQQLSGKAAATIHRRLLERLPNRAADRPQALCRLSDEEIRSAGISRAKVLALRDLAERSISGELPERRRLSRLTDAEVIDRLTEVRGVGRWTAEMILIFWLRRPDVLPCGDLGVRRGFSITHRLDRLPEPKELEKHGERWSPYRSVAAWYLWRAVDPLEEQTDRGAW